MAVTVADRGEVLELFVEVGSRAPGAINTSWVQVISGCWAGPQNLAGWTITP